MLMGKSLLNVGFFFANPNYTAKCKVCNLEDTRRDWNSVVLGHYPGAFVLTAAEIVRTPGWYSYQKRYRLLGVDFFENGLRNPHKIEVDFKL